MISKMKVKIESKEILFEQDGGGIVYGKFKIATGEYNVSIDTSSIYLKNNNNKGIKKSLGKINIKDENFLTIKDSKIRIELNASLYIKHGGVFNIKIL